MAETLRGEAATWRALRMRPLRDYLKRKGISHAHVARQLTARGWDLNPSRFHKVLWGYNRLPAGMLADIEAILEVRRGAFGKFDDQTETRKSA